MKKSMLIKLFALMLAVCVVFSFAIIVSSAADTATATITFDNLSKMTSSTTSQQIWEENGIVVTYGKGSYTSNLAEYAKPARFYSGTTLTIEAPGEITKIEFDANNTSYATALKNSISTATVSSDIVTVTLDGTSKTYTVAKMSAQVRMDAITVTYNTSGGTSQPEEPTKEYTASFSTPNGVTVDSLTGSEITIPGCDVPTGDFKNNYTFAGWAIQSVSDTTDKPALYKEGDTVELTEDTTFYAVYSYIVESAGGSTTQYIKGDATDGAEVVITMTTSGGTVYALSSANGTSEAPTATIVTVSGSNITGDVADDLKWTVAKDGGSYIFYLKGDTSKWLYCTSSNNGVRVGTNANNTFTIDATSGYLKHTGTNRYVGVYTANPDWRCYTNTTGNIANQTLGFYVLSASGGETTYYTTTLESGECDHNYVGVETQAPTCRVPGIMTYTCDKCADSYTEAIAVVSHVDVDSNGVCENCGYYVVSAGYTLLEDVSNLVDGAQIIIVAKDYDFAISTNQKTSNRGQVAIAKDGKLLSFGNDAQILTVIKNVDGTFAFYTGKGYLVNTTQDDNKLLTQAEENWWTVTVENGVAAITSTIGERNQLRYNASSSLFSCYASGQKDVSIYYVAPCAHSFGDPVVTEAPTCSSVGEESCICSKCYFVEYSSVPKLDHTWNAGETVETPTCTKRGEVKYTCTVCSATKKEYSAKLGHEYVGGTQTLAPTCNRVGTLNCNCTRCDKTIAVDIPMTGEHNYVGGVCTSCGMKDSSAEDYSGRYYIAATRDIAKTAWYMSNTLKETASVTAFGAVHAGAFHEYEIFEGDESSEYVYVLEKVGDVYYVYAEGIEGEEKYLAWSEENSGIFTTKDNAVKFNVDYYPEARKYELHFTSDEGERYLSLNRTSGDDYFALYRGTQVQTLSLVSIIDEADKTPSSYEGVQLQLGTDLSVIYRVFVPHGTPTMTFELVGDKIITVTEYTRVGHVYTFILKGVGPHQMATVINPTLIADGVECYPNDEYYNDYCINTYLNNLKIKYPDNAALLKLVDATLAYGVKSNAFVSVTADNTIDLSGVSIDTSLIKMPTKSSANAYFKSAGVFFDTTNEIYVKFYAEEGFTLVAGGKDLTSRCELIGENQYKLYTDPITATKFGDGIVFTIMYGETEAAELSYNVNAYAAAMQNNSTKYMADLAKALYLYGEAAKEYKAANQ